MDYYVQLDCPECGHENKQRGYTTLEEDGSMLIDPVMQFSQMGMECENCEVYFGTGDIDVFTA